MRTRGATVRIQRNARLVSQPSLTCHGYYVGSGDASRRTSHRNRRDSDFAYGFRRHPHGTTRPRSGSGERGDALAGDREVGGLAVPQVLAVVVLDDHLMLDPRGADELVGEGEPGGEVGGG